MVFCKLDKVQENSNYFFSAIFSKKLFEYCKIERRKLRQNSVISWNFGITPTRFNRYGSEGKLSHPQQKA